MLRRLGAVQLDTISVLARSHELVAYARLGAVGRAKVEKAYWRRRRLRVLVARRVRAAGRGVAAVRLSPALLPRRAAGAGTRCPRTPARACSTRLRANGPMTVTELGGARRGGEWWDWSDVKIAVEWLLDVGDVVCTERRAWKRVYDLPERALPPRGAGRRARRRDVPAPAGRARPAPRSASRRSATWPTTTASSAIRSGRCSTPPTSWRSTVEGWRDDGVGRPRRRWRRSRRAGAIARRCCRPSTRSCGTARGRCGSSTSSTAWRPTCRRPSACTATSRCRCWPAGACAAASIPGARARRSWPSGCRASRGAVDAMAAGAARGGRVGRLRRRRARGGRSAGAGRAAARRCWPELSRRVVAAAAGPLRRCRREPPLPELLPLPPGVLPLPPLRPLPPELPLPPPLSSPPSSSPPDVVVAGAVVVVPVEGLRLRRRRACFLVGGRLARGLRRGRRALGRRQADARADRRRGEADRVARDRVGREADARPRGTSPTTARIAVRVRCCVMASPWSSRRGRRRRGRRRAGGGEAQLGPGAAARAGGERRARAPAAARGRRRWPGRGRCPGTAPPRLALPR